MIINDKNGISLLELIVAVALVSTAVAIIGPLFPKMTRDINNNRQRAVATTLAISKLEDFKKVPYLYITPTPDIGSACDCGSDTVDYSGLNSDTVSSAGMTFTRSACMNYVTNTMMASCTDTGYMNIRVQVSWMSGANSYKVQQEALITRY